MNREVFLSLLALDSYNRGYGQNVLLNKSDSTTGQNEIGGFLGEAQIVDQRINSEAQDVGFYAIAYTWNGETIISYRGTNFPKDHSATEVAEFITQDFGGGWDLFTGIGSGSHAKLARDFYVSVTGYDFVGSDSDPIATGVTLTGHSLGGGLAGYVASRTFANANVFDPVPFGSEAYANAISEAFFATLDEFGLTNSDFAEWAGLAGAEILSSLIPGTDSPGQLFADRFAENISDRAPYFGHADGYSLEGELAASIDVVQSAIGAALIGAPFPLNSLGLQQIAMAAANAASGDRAGIVTVDNRDSGDLSDPVALHSMSWLTMTLFGEKQWHTEGGADDWEISFKYVLPKTSDSDIAAHLGLSSATGATDAGSQMASMIAYSLIDEGERPFGDTSIRAMFDDADDFGKAIAGLPGFIDEDVRDQIGALIVEFSGLLATTKVFQQRWTAATNGILSYSDGAQGEALLIDLTDASWSLDDILLQPHDILARDELVEDLIVKSLGTNLAMSDRGYVLTEMQNWLNSSGQQTPDGVFSDIKGISIALREGLFTKAPKDAGRVLLIGSDGADSVQLDAEDSPAIIIGGGGNNTIRGSSQTSGLPGDILIGGDENDELTGGSGSDLFYGGSGNNTIDGGDGHDTAIYARSGTINVRYNSANAHGPLQVFGTNVNDTLTSIEHVKVQAPLVYFDLSGTIDHSQIGSEANLMIEAQGVGQLGQTVKQIINGQGLDHGLGVRISADDGPKAIYNVDSGATIELIGFNTEIIGSHYDDEIYDASDQEKVIFGGAGNDYLSVEDTHASAVIFGGAGADTIVGGHLDDYIVDEIDYWHDLNDEMNAPHSYISSGSGNDTIVVTLTRSDFISYNPTDDAGLAQHIPGNDQYAPLLTVDPGKGDDRLIIDMISGQFRYKYRSGDGSDQVDVRGFSNSVYAPTVFGSSTYYGGVYQPRFFFDFEDISSQGISATFTLDEQSLVGEDLPNEDFPANWDVVGSLRFDFPDGGSIVFNNFRAIIFGRGDGVWDQTVIGVTTADGPQHIYASVIGDTIPHPNYSNRSSPSFTTNETPSESLGLRSGAFAVEANVPVDEQPSEGDQDVFLSVGNQRRVGGAGHDRLVITWDLSSLEASLNGAELTVSDTWGVIGETVVTDFDEVYSVIEDITYTPEQFVVAIAGRQRTAQIRGTSNNDTLTGADQRDSIFGEAGNDALYGLGGDDLLDGGLGADTMYGGAGADTYIVDDALDVIVELSDEGEDTVESSIDFILPEYVENLHLRGSSELVGTGNAAANVIRGNTSSNILNGLAGNDHLHGENGDDQLFGGDGDDVLDGGLGYDYMEGGSGNDQYFVDSQWDQIFEIADGGNDTVYASLNLYLPDYVEGLVLLGSATNGSGNDLDNVLIGNERNNSLYGEAGSDVLKGGAGNDSLYGDGWTGGGGDDYLDGGAGDDYLSGDEGDDYLDGGTGDDYLNGGDGNDTLHGGEGSDQLDGDKGDDLLYGGAGDDTFFDISGNDLFVGSGRATLRDIGKVIFPSSVDETNTVIFYGSAYNSLITELGNGWLRVDHATGETDYLVNIQEIAFEGPDENEAPFLDYTMDDLDAEAGHEFSFDVPDDLFYDPNFDRLTLTASLANGDPLPNWLEFDGRRLSGSAPSAMSGDLTLMLTASDGVFSDSTTFTFTITPGQTGGGANAAPTADSSMADIWLARGETLDFSIPPSTFTDPDGDALSYTATLANGDALPGWLSFTNGQFSGVVPAAELGSYDIRLIASDPSGAQAFDVFRLTVGVSTGGELTPDQWALFTNGNDRVVGRGKSNELIDAGDGDDYITTDGWQLSASGAGGNDVIELLGAENAASGGAGADVFIFDGGSFLGGTRAASWGTVQDFEAGTDRIGIVNGYARVTDFASLQPYLSQDGSDALITLGGLPEIRLVGVSVSALSASDFMFGAWETSDGHGPAPMTGLIPYPQTEAQRWIGDWENIGNQSERIVANGSWNTSVETMDGDDYITSDGQYNDIYAGRGNDVIEIQASNNYVVGGPGHDYYVFDAARFTYNGWDDLWATIGHYHDGYDKIAISVGTGGVSSFNDLSSLLVQNGDDVRIAFADLPDILVENTTVADLDATDFLFFEAPAAQSSSMRTSETSADADDHLARPSSATSFRQPGFNPRAAFANSNKGQSMGGHRPLVEYMHSINELDFDDTRTLYGFGGKPPSRVSKDLGMSSEDAGGSSPKLHHDVAPTFSIHQQMLASVEDGAHGSSIANRLALIRQDMTAFGARPHVELHLASSDSKGPVDWFV